MALDNDKKINKKSKRQQRLSLYNNNLNVIEKKRSDGKVYPLKTVNYYDLRFSDPSLFTQANQRGLRRWADENRVLVDPSFRPEIAERLAFSVKLEQISEHSPVDQSMYFSDIYASEQSNEELKSLYQNKVDNLGLSANELNSIEGKAKNRTDVLSMNISTEAKQINDDYNRRLREYKSKRNFYATYYEGKTEKPFDVQSPNLTGKAYTPGKRAYWEDKWVTAGGQVKHVWEHPSIKNMSLWDHIELEIIKPLAYAGSVIIPSDKYGYASSSGEGITTTESGDEIVPIGYNDKKSSVEDLLVEKTGQSKVLVANPYGPGYIETEASNIKCWESVVTGAIPNKEGGLANLAKGAHSLYVGSARGMVSLGSLFASNEGRKQEYEEFLDELDYAYANVSTKSKRAQTQGQFQGENFWRFAGEMVGMFMGSRGSYAGTRVITKGARRTFEKSALNNKIIRNSIFKVDKSNLGTPYAQTIREVGASKRALNLSREAASGYKTVQTEVGKGITKFLDSKVGGYLEMSVSTFPMATMESGIADAEMRALGFDDKTRKEVNLAILALIMGTEATGLNLAYKGNSKLVVGSALKKAVKGISKEADEIFGHSPSAAKKAFFKRNILRKIKGLSLHDFRGHVITLGATMGEEGIEEFFQGEGTDIIKNVTDWHNFQKEQAYNERIRAQGKALSDNPYDRPYFRSDYRFDSAKGAFGNIANRIYSDNVKNNLYMQEALGGALGGIFFSGGNFAIDGGVGRIQKRIFSNRDPLSKDMDKESFRAGVATMVAMGKAQEAKDIIDQLLKDGQLGPNNVDENDEILSPENLGKGKSVAEILHKQYIDYIDILSDIKAKLGNQALSRGANFAGEFLELSAQNKELEQELAVLNAKEKEEGKLESKDSERIGEITKQLEKNKKSIKEIIEPEEGSKYGKRANDFKKSLILTSAYNRGKSDEEYIEKYKKGEEGITKQDRETPEYIEIYQKHDDNFNQSQLAAHKLIYMRERYNAEFRALSDKILKVEKEKTSEGLITYKGLPGAIREDIKNNDFSAAFSKLESLIRTEQNILIKGDSRRHSPEDLFKLTQEVVNKQNKAKEERDKRLSSIAKEQQDILDQKDEIGEDKKLTKEEKEKKGEALNKRYIDLQKESRKTSDRYSISENAELADKDQEFFENLGREEITNVKDMVLNLFNEEITKLKEYKENNPDESIDFENYEEAENAFEMLKDALSGVDTFINGIDYMMQVGENKDVLKDNNIDTEPSMESAEAANSLKQLEDAKKQGQDYLDKLSKVTQGSREEDRVSHGIRNEFKKKAINTVLSYSAIEKIMDEEDFNRLKEIMKSLDYIDITSFDVKNFTTLPKELKEKVLEQAKKLEEAEDIISKYADQIFTGDILKQMIHDIGGGTDNMAQIFYSILHPNDDNNNSYNENLLGLFRGQLVGTTKNEYKDKGFAGINDVKSKKVPSSMIFASFFAWADSLSGITNKESRSILNDIYEKHKDNEDFHPLTHEQYDTVKLLWALQREQSKVYKEAFSYVTEGYLKTEGSVEASGKEVKEMMLDIHAAYVRGGYATGKSAITLPYFIMGVKRMNDISSNVDNVKVVYNTDRLMADFMINLSILDDEDYNINIDYVDAQVELSDQGKKDKYDVVVWDEAGLINAKDSIRQIKKFQEKNLKGNKPFILFMGDKSQMRDRRVDKGKTLNPHFADFMTNTQPMTRVFSTDLRILRELSQSIIQSNGRDLPEWKNQRNKDNTLVGTRQHTTVKGVVQEFEEELSKQTIPENKPVIVFANENDPEIKPYLDLNGKVKPEYSAYVYLLSPNLKENKNTRIKSIQGLRHKHVYLAYDFQNIRNHNSESITFYKSDSGIAGYTGVTRASQYVSFVGERKERTGTMYGLSPSNVQARGTYEAIEENKVMVGEDNLQDIEVGESQNKKEKNETPVRNKEFLDKYYRKGKTKQGNTLYDAKDRGVYHSILVNEETGEVTEHLKFQLDDFIEGVKLEIRISIGDEIKTSFRAPKGSEDTDAFKDIKEVLSKELSKLKTRNPFAIFYKVVESLSSERVIVAEGGKNIGQIKNMEKAFAEDLGLKKNQEYEIVSTRTGGLFATANVTKSGVDVSFSRGETDQFIPSNLLSSMMKEGFSVRNEDADEESYSEEDTNQEEVTTQSNIQINGSTIQVGDEVFYKDDYYNVIGIVKETQGKYAVILDNNNGFSLKVSGDNLSLINYSGMGESISGGGKAFYEATNKGKRNVGYVFGSTTVAFKMPYKRNKEVSDVRTLIGSIHYKLAKKGSQAMLKYKPFENYIDLKSWHGRINKSEHVIDIVANVSIADIYEIASKKEAALISRIKNKLSKEDFKKFVESLVTIGSIEKPQLSFKRPLTTEMLEDDNFDVDRITGKGHAYEAQSRESNIALYNLYRGFIKGDVKSQLFNIDPLSFYIAMDYEKSIPLDQFLEDNSNILSNFKLVVDNNKGQSRFRLYDTQTRKYSHTDILVIPMRVGEEPVYYGQFLREIKRGWKEIKKQRSNSAFMEAFNRKDQDSMLREFLMQNKRMINNKQAGEISELIEINKNDIVIYEKGIGDTRNHENKHKRDIAVYDKIVEILSDNSNRFISNMMYPMILESRMLERSNESRVQVLSELNNNHLLKVNATRIHHPGYYVNIDEINGSVRQSSKTKTKDIEAKQDNNNGRNNENTDDDDFFDKHDEGRIVRVNIENFNESLNRILGNDNSRVSLFDTGEVNQVKANLRIVNTLLNKILPVRKTIRRSTNEKPYLDENLKKELGKHGVPIDQIKLLFNYLEDNNINEISTEQLALDLASTYGYTVEINTSRAIADEDRYDFTTVKSVEEANELGEGWEHFESFEGEAVYRKLKPGFDSEGISNSQYYSDLTVPGGTNYTENEISTPLITPIIKGHAAFSTDKGIGWFRSDEQIDSKTRRLLEFQSDLFQKGREKKDLVDINKEQRFWIYSINGKEASYLEVQNKYRELGKFGFPFNKDTEEEIEIKGIKFGRKLDTQLEKNQFLQLLNKDNNWVTFFIKSIIQDSAKKGYTTVLFPKGETIAKIEGHETIAKEIENIDARISTLKATSQFYWQIKSESGSAGGRFRTKEEALIKLKSKPMWVAGGYSEENIVKVYRDKEIYERELAEEIARKHELETQGIEKIRPIEGFYEIRVTNILKKYYNVREFTDEHGNKWNKVEVSPLLAQGSEIVEGKELNDGKEVFGKLREGRMIINVIDGTVKFTTPRHEVFHWMMNHVFKSEIRQEVLLRGREIMMSLDEYSSHTADEILDVEVEEFLAEEYAKMYSGKDVSDGVLKMSDTFSYIRSVDDNLSKERDYLEHMFKDIEDGHYASMGRGATEFSYEVLYDKEDSISEDYGAKFENKSVHENIDIKRIFGGIEGYNRFQKTIINFITRNSWVNGFNNSIEDNVKSFMNDTRNKAKEKVYKTIIEEYEDKEGKKQTRKVTKIKEPYRQFEDITKTYDISKMDKKTSDLYGRYLIANDELFYPLVNSFISGYDFENLREQKKTQNQYDHTATSKQRAIDSMSSFAMDMFMSSIKYIPTQTFSKIPSLDEMIKPENNNVFYGKKKWEEGGKPFLGRNRSHMLKAANLMKETYSKADLEKLGTDELLVSFLVALEEKQDEITSNGEDRNVYFSLKNAFAKLLHSYRNISDGFESNNTVESSIKQSSIEGFIDRLLNTYLYASNNNMVNLKYNDDGTVQYIEPFHNHSEKVKNEIKDNIVSQLFSGESISSDIAKKMENKFFTNDNVFYIQYGEKQVPIVRKINVEQYNGETKETYEFINPEGNQKLILDTFSFLGYKQAGVRNSLMNILKSSKENNPYKNYNPDWILPTGKATFNASNEQNMIQSIMAATMYGSFKSLKAAIKVKADIAALGTEEASYNSLEEIQDAISESEEIKEAKEVLDLLNSGNSFDLAKELNPGEIENDEASDVQLISPASFFQTFRILGDISTMESGTENDSFAYDKVGNRFLKETVDNFIERYQGVYVHENNPIYNENSGVTTNPIDGRFRRIQKVESLYTDMQATNKFEVKDHMHSSLNSFISGAMKGEIPISMLNPSDRLDLYQIILSNEPTNSLFALHETKSGMESVTNHYDFNKGVLGRFEYFKNVHNEVVNDWVKFIEDNNLKSLVKDKSSVLAGKGTLNTKYSEKIAKEFFAFIKAFKQNKGEQVAIDMIRSSNLVENLDYKIKGNDIYPSNDLTFNHKMFNAGKYLQYNSAIKDVFGKEGLRHDKDKNRQLALKRDNIFFNEYFKDFKKMKTLSGYTPNMDLFPDWNMGRRSKTDAYITKEGEDRSKILNPIYSAYFWTNIVYGGSFNDMKFGHRGLFTSSENRIKRARTKTTPVIVSAIKRFSGLGSTVNIVPYLDVAETVNIQGKEEINHEAEDGSSYFELLGYQMFKMSQGKENAIFDDGVVKTLINTSEDHTAKNLGAKLATVAPTLDMYKGMNSFRRFEHNMLNSWSDKVNKMFKEEMEGAPIKRDVPEFNALERFQSSLSRHDDIESVLHDFLINLNNDYGKDDFNKIKNEIPLMALPKSSLKYGASNLNKNHPVDTEGTLSMRKIKTIDVSSVMNLSENVEDHKGRLKIMNQLNALASQLGPIYSNWIHDIKTKIFDLGVEQYKQELSQYGKTVTTRNEDGKLVVTTEKLSDIERVKRFLRDLGLSGLKDIQSDVGFIEKLLNDKIDIAEPSVAEKIKQTFRSYVTENMISPRMDGVRVTLAPSYLIEVYQLEGYEYPFDLRELNEKFGYQTKITDKIINKKESIIVKDVDGNDVELKKYKFKSMEKDDNGKVRPSDAAGEFINRKDFSMKPGQSIHDFFTVTLKAVPGYASAQKTSVEVLTGKEPIEIANRIMKIYKKLGNFSIQSPILDHLRKLGLEVDKKNIKKIVRDFYEALENINVRIPTGVLGQTHLNKMVYFTSGTNNTLFTPSGNNLRDDKDYDGDQGSLFTKNMTGGEIGNLQNEILALYKDAMKTEFDKFDVKSSVIDKINFAEDNRPYEGSDVWDSYSESLNSYDSAIVGSNAIAIQANVVSTLNMVGSLGEKIPRVFNSLKQSDNVLRDNGDWLQVALDNANNNVLSAFGINHHSMNMLASLIININNNNPNVTREEVLQKIQHFFTNPNIKHIFRQIQEDNALDSFAEKDQFTLINDRIFAIKSKIVRDKETLGLSSTNNHKLTKNEREGLIALKNQEVEKLKEFKKKYSKLLGNLNYYQIGNLIEALDNDDTDAIGRMLDKSGLEGNDKEEIVLAISEGFTFSEKQKDIINRITDITSLERNVDSLEVMNAFKTIVITANWLYRVSTFVGSRNGIKGKQFEYDKFYDNSSLFLGMDFKEYLETGKVPTKEEYLSYFKENSNAYQSANTQDKRDNLLLMESKTYEIMPIAELLSIEDSSFKSVKKDLQPYKDKYLLGKDIGIFMDDVYGYKRLTKEFRKSIYKPTVSNSKRHYALSEIIDGMAIVHMIKNLPKNEKEFSIVTFGLNGENEPISIYNSSGHALIEESKISPDDTKSIQFFRDRVPELIRFLKTDLHNATDARKFYRDNGIEEHYDNVILPMSKSLNDEGNLFAKTLDVVNNRGKSTVKLDRVDDVMTLGLKQGFDNLYPDLQRMLAYYSLIASKTKTGKYSLSRYIPQQYFEQLSKSIQAIKKMLSDEEVVDNMLGSFTDYAGSDTEIIETLNYGKKKFKQRDVMDNIPKYSKTRKQKGIFTFDSSNKNYNDEQRTHKRIERISSTGLFDHTERMVVEDDEIDILRMVSAEDQIRLQNGENVEINFINSTSYTDGIYYLNGGAVVDVTVYNKGRTIELSKTDKKKIPNKKRNYDNVPYNELNNQINPGNTIVEIDGKPISLRDAINRAVKSKDVENVSKVETRQQYKDVGNVMIDAYYQNKREFNNLFKEVGNRRISKAKFEKSQNSSQIKSKKESDVSEHFIAGLNALNNRINNVNKVNKLIAKEAQLKEADVVLNMMSAFTGGNVPIIEHSSSAAKKMGIPGNKIAWVASDGVHVNRENLNLQVPMHELTHIFNQYIRQNKAGIWKDFKIRANDLIDNDILANAIIDKVRTDNLKRKKKDRMDEDDIIDEFLATYSGLVTRKVVQNYLAENDIMIDDSEINTILDNGTELSKRLKEVQQEIVDEAANTNIDFDAGSLINSGLNSVFANLVAKATNERSVVTKDVLSPLGDKKMFVEAVMADKSSRIINNVSDFTALFENNINSQNIDSGPGFADYIYNLRTFRKEDVVTTTVRGREFSYNYTGSEENINHIKQRILEEVVPAYNSFEEEFSGKIKEWIELLIDNKFKESEIDGSFEKVFGDKMEVSHDVLIDYLREIGADKGIESVMKYSDFAKMDNLNPQLKQAYDKDFQGNDPLILFHKQGNTEAMRVSLLDPTTVPLDRKPFGLRYNNLTGTIQSNSDFRRNGGNWKNNKGHVRLFQLGLLSQHLMRAIPEIQILKSSVGQLSNTSSQVFTIPDSVIVKQNLLAVSRSEDVMEYIENDKIKDIINNPIFEDNFSFERLKNFYLVNKETLNYDVLKPFLERVNFTRIEQIKALKEFMRYLERNNVLKTSEVMRGASEYLLRLEGNTGDVDLFDKEVKDISFDAAKTVGMMNVEHPALQLLKKVYDSSRAKSINIANQFDEEVKEPARKLMNQYKKMNAKNLIINNLVDHSSRFFEDVLMWTDAYDPKTKKHVRVKTEFMHYDKNDPRTRAALNDPKVNLTEEHLDLVNKYMNIFKKLHIESLLYENKKNPNYDRAMAEADFKTYFGVGNIMPIMDKSVFEMLTNRNKKTRKAGGKKWRENIGASEKAFEDIRSEDLGDSFTINSIIDHFSKQRDATVRNKMLGLEIDSSKDTKFDSAGNPMRQYIVLDEARNRAVSSNIYNSFRYFSLSVARKKVFEEDYMPMKTAVEVYLSTRAHLGSPGNKYENTLNFVEEWTDRLVNHMNRDNAGNIIKEGEIFNKDLSFNAAVWSRGLMNTFAFASLGYNFTLGLKSSFWNASQAIFLSVSNELNRKYLKNIEDGVRNGGKEVMYGFGSFTKAYALLKNPRNLKKYFRLARQMGVIAHTEREYLESFIHNPGKRHVIQRDLAQLPNLASDTITRITSMLAVMIEDGSLNAHVYDDKLGTWKWDETKDLRFYDNDGNKKTKKGEHAILEHIKNNMDDLNCYRTNENGDKYYYAGYDPHMIANIRRVVDKYIVGCMSEDVRPLWDNHWARKFVSQFRVFSFEKLYNAGFWASKRRTIHGANYKAIKDKDGNWIAVQDIIETNGFMQILFGGMKAIVGMSDKNLRGYANSLSMNERMLLFRGLMRMAGALGIFFAVRGFGDDEDDWKFRWIWSDFLDTWVLFDTIQSPIPAMRVLKDLFNVLILQEEFSTLWNYYPGHSTVDDIKEYVIDPIRGDIENRDKDKRWHWDNFKIETAYSK